MAVSEADLQSGLQRHVGGRRPVAAAAVVSAEVSTVVAVGCAVDAHFEIGSVSKGITGLLYADALRRGEIGPDSTLAEFLPLADTPVAGLTLASLSTHHSGLPRLANPTLTFRRSLELQALGRNPYGEGLLELLGQVRGVQVGVPRTLYSNLGFELLGHALAFAAGLSYGELLSERIARPLGLDTVHAPGTAADIRPGAVAGRGPRGWPRQPWTGEALAPAGGIRASVTDLARLIGAMLDGSAPGLTALEPAADFAEGRTRIGAAWMITTVRGHQVTWHNGMTGGFASWVGMNRAAGTGVAVLSATAQSVDEFGLSQLLG